MANYYGTTVSQGGKLKEGYDNKKLNDIVFKYSFGDGDGDLNIEVQNGELQIWGESATRAYLKEDEEMDAEVFDDFLKEICEFLAEPLIVSEVGNEKCRYVCGYAYIAKPNGEVVSVSLEEAIENELKKDEVLEVRK